MEQKSPQQCIESLSRILNEIRSINNEVYSTTNDLNIVLLNLQIEGAHIKEANAVGVIAEELRKSISTMHSHVQSLLSNRKELQETEARVVEILNKI